MEVVFNGLWPRGLRHDSGDVEKASVGRCCWPESLVVLWWELSPMAGAGFLQSLWEKQIWEGVWLYLDPMDSVCLRTASVEWNVPGKYGPHGELFFFLIEKEPATMPGSETSSPFFTADIRAPFFSADVLKKCALIAMHLIAEERKSCESGCRTADWRRCQRWWYPRVSRCSTASSFARLLSRCTAQRKDFPGCHKVTRETALVHRDLGAVSAWKGS